ncbi:uncharacterized protein HMPREF1541_02603 [Cyphellophora europaea CBS 101466]|uniref:Uncharacterized protein n=1 Tax=Cyphellophora europaea (strain CBS 101466) TaxID=1220924 RepID=W2S6A1_CYPE1|nr:uncharacterized protein HMPREF1541_02603 [Cyphellophora europaea CBS 101466]ETN43444.1 hypothetical protein HMPREF1541_02603 [Cyphellophora europaea CBS 101466]
MGLGLNAPAVPSSLSKEVAMGAAEDTAGAIDLTDIPATAAEPAVLAPTSVPLDDIAMVDVPVSDVPAAIIAEASTATPAHLVSNVTTLPQPSPRPPISPTLDPSPITPPPREDPAPLADDVDTSSLPSWGRQQKRSPSPSTPLRPAKALLIQGVEIPTAEQVVAEAATGVEGVLPEEVSVAGSQKAREEEALREAAVQGEIGGFKAVEAGKEVEEGVAGKAEEGGEGAGSDGVLDLLGGLERDIEEQQGVGEQ